MRDIDFVLAKPNDWFPHADGRIMLFRQSDGSIPALRDFRQEGGSFRIVSVYIMDKKQIAGKMKEKRRLLESLGQAGQSPGRLSVAEYLHRSSAPGHTRNAPHQAPNKTIDQGTSENNGGTKDAFARPSNVRNDAANTDTTERDEGADTGGPASGPQAPLYSRATSPDLTPAQQDALAKTSATGSKSDWLEGAKDTIATKRLKKTLQRLSARVHRPWVRWLARGPIAARQALSDEDWAFISGSQY